MPDMETLSVISISGNGYLTLTGIFVLLTIAVLSITKIRLYI